MGDKCFKIALVNPKDTTIPIEDYSVYENLGLATLAATLRSHGYQVRIIDGYAENLDHDVVADKVVKFDPNLVGFTCTYQSYPDVLEIGRKIKRQLLSVHLTIGGEHATFTANEILTESGIFDSVIRGEGEETLLELVTVMEFSEPLKSIRGIHFKYNGEISANPDRPAIQDLDKLPFASRDTIEYCLKKKKPALIGMLASRGCYNNCSFCNANKYFRLGGGKALRKRSPQNVVDEITLIYNNYISRGLQAKLYFYDANFVTRDKVGKQWAREIAEGMIKQGIYIPFEIFARADSFTEEDNDLVNIMKKAGLDSVFIGFESGTEDVLGAYNKGISAAQNRRAVEILKKYNILGVTNGFIMFGPYITLRGLKESAEFLLMTGQASFWNMSQRLQLFPGIALIDKLREEKLLKPDYSSLNVYGYEFKDPHVEVLAKKLDFNNEPVTRKENSLVRYIKETINYLQKLALSKNFHDSFSLSLKKQLDAKFQQICHINFIFFNEVVDLSKNKWSEKIFQEKKTHYLKKIADELDKLENIFKSYLKCFNE
jgi:radical SAM superfamily enzyme YgiQ (UPF0313 family)